MNIDNDKFDKLVEDLKTSPPELEGLESEKAKRMLEQYIQYQQSLIGKRRKCVEKDPDLVIKNKKTKRRLSNKNRKINQAKARHNKFTK